MPQGRMQWRILMNTVITLWVLIFLGAWGIYSRCCVALPWVDPKVLIDWGPSISAPLTKKVAVGIIRRNNDEVNEYFAYYTFCWTNSWKLRNILTARTSGNEESCAYGDVTPSQYICIRCLSMWMCLHCSISLRSTVTSGDSNLDHDREPSLPKPYEGLRMNHEVKPARTSSPQ
jgi:hypothetical protein